MGIENIPNISYNTTNSLERRKSDQRRAQIRGLTAFVTAGIFFKEDEIGFPLKTDHREEPEGGSNTLFYV